MMPPPFFGHIDFAIGFVLLPLCNCIRTKDSKPNNMKKTFTTLFGASGTMFAKVLCVVAMLISFSSANAQRNDSDIFKLAVEARFDYLNQALAGEVDPASSGFKVRYFNLRMDGQITSHFSYSWRQRFNRVNSLSDFAENTDWLTLTYKPTENWAISAGKQVVMIGGFEYDRAPMDLYFCSEYWNNVACYQIGASVAYTTRDSNDTILFQVCQSPYQKSAPNLIQNGNGSWVPRNNLLAYNLYWTASYDWYTGLHSLNLVEYQRGKYDFYLVLGNQFKFGDATIQIDLMDRCTDIEDFDNFSIMGEVAYLFGDCVNLFAKATYDTASEDYAPGLYIQPGTSICRVGGGVEYYPLGRRGSRDVRLHAAYAYNFGDNTNPAGTALDKGSYLTVGLTWRIDIMSAARKIIQKTSNK